MKILNIKKATPMSTGVIVTCDKYTEKDVTSDGIINTALVGSIKEIQTIVSPSESAKARGVEVGLLVALSFERYKKSKNVKNSNFGIDEEFSKQFYYDFPYILLDGREHLLIDVSDIELKIDEFDYVEEELIN